MIVPRVFKSRQRKRKNISIVLSSQKSSEICGFRNFFCAFCGTLESEEKVVHNATITAVKKVRKLGFEKVTFCNFFGERFCTHAEFLWPVAP